MAENLSSATQNFASFANGGVDPRTGLYSFTLNIPMAPANALAGPDFDLALSFNPLGGDDWGYGQGWSPSLSRLERTAPRTLALSTGEHFPTGGQEGEPQVLQRKLQSFRLFRDSSNQARVVHRSGRIEHLNYPGFGDHLVPTFIEGPDGRWIALGYVNDAGRPRLEGITDEAGNELLRIVKSGNDLLLYPASEEDDFYYKMTFQSGRLQTLALPASIGGQWSFGYYGNDDYPSINQVTQPLGAVEQMLYHEVHKVPGGRPDLPRVTQYTLHPGGEAQPVQQTFRYSTGEHNFLGYNQISTWPQDGTDPLYAVRSNYEYGATMTQTHGAITRRIERTYNRFHLQLNEVTTQGNCQFTRTTHYGDLAGKNFDELAHTFQMPAGVTSTWYDSSTEEKREETTHASYDEHGNLISQIEASGIQTDFTYYAATGEDGCPPDPWGFVRHMKTSTRLPAPADPSQGIEGGGTVQVTAYRYTTLPLPAPASPGLTRQVPGSQAASHYVLVEQVTTQALAKAEDTTPLDSQTVTFEYYQNPADPLSFGRLKTRTANYQGHTSSQSNAYEPLPGKPEFGMMLAGRSELAARFNTVVTQTNSDGTGSQTAVEQSLRTGQTLRSVDALNVETASRYDGLGRLLSLAVPPGSDIEAERTFAYRGHSQEQGLAEQYETSAAGVARGAKVDGLGRPVERYQGDGGLTAAAPALVWQGRYNPFGQLAEETAYDDCGADGTWAALTTRHEYDDWGQLRASIGADGVCQVNQTSPFGGAGPVSRSKREYTDAQAKVHTDGLRETRYNGLGQAWETTAYDAAGSAAERVRYYYDGFGTLLREEHWYATWTENGPGQETRTTAYQYDAWGRLVLTTLPNGDLVGQGYAEHSPQGLLEQLSYGRRADALTPLANRRVDQLARVTEAHQGGRTARWAYDGASPSPRQVTLADGSTVDYTYRPALTAEPLSVSSAGEGYAFTYNALTGRLEQARAHNGTATIGGIDCEYQYNPLGQLTSEKRQGGAYETAYAHSVQGRRLSRDDSGVGACTWRYDASGRAQQTHTGQATATVGYDLLGNLREWQCAGVKTTLSFDNLGRETERRLVRQADGEPLQRYTLHWHGNGTLAGRDTYAGSASTPVLTERFGYDQRNRLSRHDCTGDAAWLPRDRFGAAYTQQVFALDALDNVTRLLTRQADGAICTSVFTYAASDACQLASVLHTWTDKRTLTEAFEYDTQGRMTGRSSGNEQTTLEYDTLGRLLALTTAAGRSAYHYDPHGTLCAVEHNGQRQERFYEGYAIDHTRSGATVQRYLRTAGTPVALIDGAGQAKALLADSTGSVTGEWEQNLLSRAVYSAYGSQHTAEGQASHGLGFNGELREAAQDAYLLGRGYRLYDPGLMCYNAPDSESPFGAGGLNPYRYAQGNPIMLHDPSGHAPMPIWNASNLPYYMEPEKQQGQGGGWLGSIFKAIGWGFIAWEAWSLVQIVVGVVTAPVGGAMLAMAGAAALTAASLGTGIASMIDPDNSALLFAGIGLGVASGVLAGKAAGMAARAGGKEMVSTADVGVQTAEGAGALSRRSSTSSLRLLPISDDEMDIFGRARSNWSFRGRGVEAGSQTSPRGSLSPLSAGDEILMARLDELMDERIASSAAQPPVTIPATPSTIDESITTGTDIATPSPSEKPLANKKSPPPPKGILYMDIAARDANNNINHRTNVILTAAAASPALLVRR
ncbi:RHS repeat-associated core domain-containing protein [Pseudomonas typographi]|uniref:RHS repeat-associated core domain-containing protein n=1 Tax=Pseudomonas typographi TaxID=2715964 RepID=UPI0016863713|nr:RHS repeat-associated core domain-containing protein [Pseudomonas typographi]MBD1552254.1 RHS repeat-associated core domain-containing protein [Pseudomonas typographi]